METKGERFMSQVISCNFNYPVRYRLGAGRVTELAGLCKDRGMLRPLIVTDPHVKDLKWFGPVIEQLERAELEPVVFSDLRPNPVGDDVDRGVALYREAGCRGVILIGGGSAMDVGKCIALLAENEGSVFDYEDIGDNYLRADESKIAQMIAIPTTAGTGSEVGRASVIINKAHEKKIIFHPRMQPGDVIADPELTVGLPAPLTAYTGMDAYVHCFEAFCAKGYHPMADGIALEGMRLIKNYLPRAVAYGADIQARTHMILASSMAATAFQKGLGVVHAIAHALGGKLDGHHGLLNSILLPYCMVFNRDVISERCMIIARHLGVSQPSFEALLEWTLDMRTDLGIPHTLEAIPGMSNQKAAELAPLALADAALSGNPKPATIGDLEQIMRSALAGSLSM